MRTLEMLLACALITLPILSAAQSKTDTTAGADANAKGQVTKAALDPGKGGTKSNADTKEGSAATSPGAGPASTEPTVQPAAQSGKAPLHLEVVWPERVKGKDPASQLRFRADDPFETVSPGWFADCGEVHAVRLGCLLQIRATGDIARLKTAYSGRDSGIKLVLDGVVMPELAIELEELVDAKGDAYLVNIALDRNSSSTASRHAWDTVLRRYSEPLMKMNVALLVDADPAVRVGTPGYTLKFFVAPKSQVFTTIVIGVLLFLLAFTWLIRNDSILRDYKGGPYSLGKTQMAFWGLVVALCFVGVWAVTGTMENIPGSVLVLIGISAGTGLGAIAIGSKKTTDEIKAREDQLAKLADARAALEQQQTDAGKPVDGEDERRKAQAKLDEATRKLDEAEVQRKKLEWELKVLRDPAAIVKLKAEQARLRNARKTGAAHAQEIDAALQRIADELKQAELLQIEPPKPDFVRDIFDGGEGASFHRLQAAGWSIILGGVFVHSVCQVMSMPEFGETLLILMGISNGTYLGFKFPEKASV